MKKILCYCFAGLLLFLVTSCGMGGYQRNYIISEKDPDSSVKTSETRTSPK